MKENVVEKHLRTRAEAHGVLCWKFTSPNRAGVPDRILVGKHLETGENHIVFVELKRPGKTADSLQRRAARQLGRAGATVFLADTPAAADEILHIVYAIPWPASTAMSTQTPSITA